MEARKNVRRSVNISILLHAPRNSIMRPVIPRRTLPMPSSRKPPKWKWISRPVMCVCCASSLPMMWVRRSTRCWWRARWKARSCRHRAMPLLEDFKTKDGRVLTDQLSTYLIPTIWDIPEKVETVLVEVPDPNGPWGARGRRRIALPDRWHLPSAQPSTMPPASGSMNFRSRRNVCCGRWVKSECHRSADTRAERFRILS